MAKRGKKAEQSIKSILDAAARVVGKHGYGKASVARIAEEAGLSYGLIYLYFKNQQDLFNQLLPYVGEDMLAYISARAGKAETLEDRERLGFEANLEYMEKYPEMTRILAEAAFFAPETHRQFLVRMAEGYVRSFRRGKQNGQLLAYDPEEFEALALMFIGAREYLLERYSFGSGKAEKLPEKIQRTYLKVVAKAMDIDPSAML